MVSHCNLEKESFSSSLSISVSRAHSRDWIEPTCMLRKANIGLRHILMEVGVSYTNYSIRPFFLHKYCTSICSIAGSMSILSSTRYPCRTHPRRHKLFSCLLLANNIRAWLTRAQKRRTRDLDIWRVFFPRTINFLVDATSCFSVPFWRVLLSFCDPGIS